MLKTLLSLAFRHAGTRDGYGSKPWKGKGWTKKAKLSRSYGHGWGPAPGAEGYPGFGHPYAGRRKGLKGFLLQALLARIARPR